MLSDSRHDAAYADATFDAYYAIAAFAACCRDERMLHAYCFDAIQSARRFAALCDALIFDFYADIATHAVCCRISRAAALILSCAMMIRQRVLLFTRARDAAALMPAKRRARYAIRAMPC